MLCGYSSKCLCVLLGYSSKCVCVLLLLLLFYNYERSWRTFSLFFAKRAEQRLKRKRLRRRRQMAKKRAKNDFVAIAANVFVLWIKAIANACLCVNWTNDFPFFCFNAFSNEKKHHHISHHYSCYLFHSSQHVAVLLLRLDIIIIIMIIEEGIKKDI